MNKDWNHKFHIVNPSPWPILSSISTGLMALSTIIWFYSKLFNLLLFSFLSLMICLTQWWRDTNRESSSQGCHSKMVQNGLIVGMILFITSEIMFFASIFWALIHLTLFPGIDCGSMWPPLNISMFNPSGLPLLNTLILITSGFFISWSQYSMLMNNYKLMVNSLVVTIVLGMLFSSIQLYEYNSASFTMSDSIYGSLFFFSTGFHGIHVLVGTIMLITSLKLMLKSYISKNQSTFFNFASWYWHFVDIVWIFLYLSIYWWPWK